MSRNSKKTKITPQNASFVIGRPWYPNQPDSSICVYAYGSQVHYGTINRAIKMRDFFNSQSPGEKYRIYQVVEVPGSEDFTLSKPK